MSGNGLDKSDESEAAETEHERPSSFDHAAAARQERAVCVSTAYVVRSLVTQLLRLASPAPSTVDAPRSMCKCLGRLVLDKLGRCSYIPRTKSRQRVAANEHGGSMHTKHVNRRQAVSDFETRYVVRRRELRAAHDTYSKRSTRRAGI